MESLRQDVRHALRLMAAHQTFSAAVLLTLALGIGANTAMFSIVYGVLLRPLPYPDSGQLVRVFEEHPGGTSQVPEGVLTDVTLDAWAPGMRTLEAVATASGGIFAVGRENPATVYGGYVSPSLFDVLRVQAVAGRFFRNDDVVEGADPVVVISYGLWQERYGGTPDAVGQTLVIGDQAHLIIGVSPLGFAFPQTDSVLWIPEAIPMKRVDPARMRTMGIIARLRPGVTPQQAAAEGTLAARSVTRPPVADRIFGTGGPVEVRVRPLVDDMTASVRPALLVLMGGVALVLFIACANVANLLMARGQARQREMAVRAALGSSRSRLVQQMITESLVFSTAGGLLGIGLAWGLVRLLPVAAPERFPRIESIQIDSRMLMFALTASLLTGVLSGVLPAMRGARAGLDAVLRAGDRRTASSAGQTLRASLLVVEAALAVMLIVGAGLLIRSFVRLINVDSGFDAANVLVAQVSLPEWNRPKASPTPFFDTLLPRLAQVPGVQAAAAGNMAPFGTESYAASFDLPLTGPDGAPVQARATNWVVTPGYGAALGLRVTSGRFLEPGDTTAPVNAMVVNEEFVRRYLQDGKPVLGRQWARTKTDAKLTEIVGVVANVLKDGLDRAPQPEIYQPASYSTRTPPPYISLVVRTTGDPVAMIAELRRLVLETDARASLDGVGSLSGKLSASVAQPRFAAWLLALFAALALAVAATGLYGVLSYSVSERRREIGVRAALGATRGRLVRLVLRQGLGSTLIGLALGLVAAAATSRLLSTLLFGVTPLDGVAFTVAPALLLLVALAACLAPAWRAATTDPAEALRAE